VEALQLFHHQQSFTFMVMIYIATSQVGTLQTHTSFSTGDKDQQLMESTGFMT
jgi:hypothetical protein